jgi:hypothetical protein
MGNQLTFSKIFKMSKMKTIQILFILTLFSCVFGCQKGEQGDVGPAGEKGAKGPMGDKGEVGITDSKGMMISSWVEVKASDWQTISATSFGIAFSLPSLTAEVASRGNVYFYMQPLGASFIYPLPYSEANGTKFFGSLFNTNNRQLFQLNYAISPASGGTRLTTDYRFRVVLIPAAARTRMAAADVDWKDYESVKSYLSLND